MADEARSPQPTGVARLTNRRARYQIIAPYYRFSLGGNKNQTQIRFGAELSHVQTKEYLDFLCERGFLRFDGSRMRYGLTERGLFLLRTCRQMDQLIALVVVEHGPAIVDVA